MLTENSNQTTDVKKEEETTRLGGNLLIIATWANWEVAALAPSRPNKYWFFLPYASPTNPNFYSKPSTNNTKFKKNSERNTYRIESEFQWGKRRWPCTWLGRGPRLDWNRSRQFKGLSNALDQRPVGQPGQLVGSLNERVGWCQLVEQSHQRQTTWADFTAGYEGSRTFHPPFQDGRKPIESQHTLHPPSKALSFRPATQLLPQPPASARSTRIHLRVRLTSVWTALIHSETEKDGLIFDAHGEAADVLIIINRQWTFISDGSHGAKWVHSHRPLFVKTLGFFSPQLTSSRRVSMICLLLTAAAKNKLKKKTRKPKAAVIRSRPNPQVGCHFHLRVTFPAMDFRCVFLGTTHSTPLVEGKKI